MKWFDKQQIGSNYAWKIKTYEGKCDKCASPWCIMHRNKAKMQMIINNLKKKSGCSPEEKRFTAYKEAIEHSYGKLGWRNRKRVGWCFENMTKTAFPSENFTGFRNFSEVHTSDFESSSSDDDSSVILLSK